MSWSFISLTKLHNFSVTKFASLTNKYPLDIVSTHICSKHWLKQMGLSIESIFFDKANDYLTLNAHISYTLNISQKMWIPNVHTL